MSEQFDMLVWRADGVDMNGDIFTPAALLAMADQLLPGTDIPLDFRFDYPVAGQIVQAWVRNQELWVSAVFTDCDVIEAIRENQFTLRPGFSIGASHISDAGHRVIEKVDIAAVGLMSNAMPLPLVRTCALCIRLIPDDGKIKVCGPCFVGSNG